MLKKIKLDIYSIPIIFWTILSIYFVITDFDIDKHVYSRLLMGSVVALVYSHVFNSLAKKYYYSYILPFIVAYYVYSIDDINLIGFKIITLVFVVAIFSYFARYFSSSLIVKILLFIGYFILLAILTSVLILTFDALFGTRVINHYLNFALVILILLIDLFFYDDKIYSSKYLNIFFILFISLALVIIYAFMFSGFIEKQYSVASIIILYSTYPLILSYFIFKKKWMLFFNILPLLFLFYYVITNMIRFGITENRYFTLLFGTLAMIFTILSIFNKINSSKIFVVLSISGILAFYTPYINAFTVTKNSLTKRYEKSTDLSEKYSIYYYGVDRNWDIKYPNLNSEDYTEVLYDTYTNNSDNVENIDISKYTKLDHYLYNYDDENKFYYEIAQMIIDNKLEMDNKKIVPIRYSVFKYKDSGKIEISNLEFIILTK